jgi:hypothetical protein
VHHNFLHGLVTLGVGGDQPFSRDLPHIGRGGAIETKATGSPMRSTNFSETSRSRETVRLAFRSEARFEICGPRRASLGAAGFTTVKRPLDSWKIATSFGRTSASRTFLYPRYLWTELPSQDSRMRSE